ncbi:MAG: methyltransferase domain-containing protein, partial [Eubacterium sp.]|nr:methyltransferase domain-containing protein [Eubacterium sp.]
IGAALMNHDELLRQMGDMETGTRELFRQLVERVETVRSVCERQIQKGMEEETGALKQLSLLLSRMAEKNHYEMEDYSNLIVDKMNDRLMDVRSEILFELLRNGQAISATKVKGRILNKVKVDTARKCGSVRLNLGAGHICFDDYINVDERQIRNIDIVADVRELPFAEQSVDEIYASHIIEHFTRHEFETVILPYWYRLLKAGGKIRVILPDLESMIEHYKNQQYEIGELREVLYGLQEYPGDVHYALYGQNELKEMFGRSGLHAEYAFVGRRNGKCYDMELVGVKV